MRTSRAHVTPRINTEAFVGQGSTMVTVLSKKYIIKLKYLFFFLLHITSSGVSEVMITGFVEVYASVALQEVGLFLVAKIENKDFLRQRHILRFLLRRVCQTSSTPLAPRLYRFSSPFADSLIDHHFSLFSFIDQMYNIINV